mmetsp:Transcript_27031/g.32753  ORF Transcript_27031/g.32753 Transcript_27031/m.32753 type:complete len:296 (+) Transcript_27031:326-1213(+)
MSQTQQQQQQRQSSGVTARVSQKVNNQKPETLLNCMRIFNIICAVAVMITGCSTLAAINDQNCSGDCSKISFGIVAFYAFVFGLLLFIFEMRFGKRLKRIFLNNFGFMYAHRGKALLIIFISTLCFSSIQTAFDRWILNLVVGIVVMVNGCFDCFVYYTHPTFSEVDMRPDQEGIKMQKSSTSRGIDLEGNTMMRADDAGNAPRSDYEFGNNENLGPAYGRYNESPFTVQESTPQPPPMEANPYADAVIEQGPFAASNAGTDAGNGMTTINVNTSDINTHDSPFQAESDNPFAAK